MTFSGLADPVINPGGTAAFFAQLSGTGITTDNDTSLWTGTASGVQRVVAEGDDIAAAGPGVKIGEILFPNSGQPPCGWNAAGKLAFQTALTGTGVTPDDDNAILAGAPGAPGALSVVVQEGVANGHRFSLSQRAFPLINSAGQVVFTPFVTPTGQSESLESIWLWTPGPGGGTRQLIAREGQQVPGLPAGIVFDSPEVGRPVFRCALNGAGQIAFSSFIAGPGISFDNKNNMAFFLTLPSGEVKLVARRGSGIDVGGGVSRLVTDLALVTLSGGEDGRPRSLSENGEMVFSAGLAKPSSFEIDNGVFTARLPGSEPTTPEVITQSPAGVSETGATLRATVNSNRGATTVYFEYGTTNNFGQVTGSQIVTGGTSPVAVSVPITGLTSGTTYHYRAVATNSAGTAEGANISFTATTGGGGNNTPVATTSLATNLTDTGATLNGSIDRKGESVSYYFEYGPTTTYGQRTTTRVSFPGTSAFPVSEAIAGLTARTPYHFRLVASSVGGSANSSDGTFSTRGPLGDFTIAITDLANGTTVAPNSRLVAGAAVKIPRGSKTKISAVQFFIDGLLVSTDDRSAYKVEAANLTPGQHTLTALGIDTNNKEVESAPVTFTVSDAAAGPLALVSSITPEDGTAAPGELITYSLFIRNSSNTDSKDVTLTLAVPFGAGYVSTRFVDASGNPVAAPKGSAISYNGGDATVTVKIGAVKAFASLRLQLLARVPYDQTVTGGLISSTGFTVSGAQKLKFTGTFTPRSVVVTGALPPGTPKPKLGLFVRQTAAGELPANRDIKIVTTAGLAVPDVKPKRLSNQIIYQVTFMNYGDAPANSVRVVVPVPPGTTYKKKSAVVRVATGDLIPVAEAEFGNLLFFDVPRLEANYPTGLGSGKTLEYTVIVNKKDADGQVIEPGPPITQITHLGAAVECSELIAKTTTLIPRVAQIVAPVRMTYSGSTTYAVPDSNLPADSANGLIYHTIFYRNQGDVTAKEAGILYTVPPELTFQSATFANHLGKPIAPKKNQPVPTFKAASQEVRFSIGTVKKNEFGFARVALKSKSGTLPDASANYSGFDATTVDAPSALRTARTARTAGTRAAGDTTAVEGTIKERLYDPALPRPFIMQAGPAAASSVAGTEIEYQITWGNMGEVSSGLNFTAFYIPPGTEYVSATTTSVFGGVPVPNDPANPGTVSNSQGVTAVRWANTAEAHSVHTATVKVKVLPGVTGEIVSGDQGDVTMETGFFQRIFAPKVVTRLLKPGEVAEDRQTEIYSSSVGLADACSIGSAPAPLGKFLENVERITTTSRVVAIGGADYVHLAGNDSIAIPLGGGYMVAAGGGNFVNTATAGMVAAGGGNLVAAGGGNMQIQVPGTGLVGSTQLIRGVPGLVAAGGMNLVAAGGLNLIRKAADLIGNDGSTLIGNDGSTLIGIDGSTLGSFSQKAGFAASFAPALTSGLTAATFAANSASLVAAGGGNMVAAGGGNFVAVGRSNLLPPTALVGNDGGTLVGNDGASLIGNDGSTLVGNDGASLIGNDGSTLTSSGAGNFIRSSAGLISDNGAIISQ